MLTNRMQVQAIADRLAGLPVKAESRDFQPPLRACWHAIEQAAPGQEFKVLEEAVYGLPERDQILQAILSARPGYRPQMMSLEEMGKGLDPIQWVWDGWIPRSMLSIIGASQGSGKSFVGLDLAARIIHGLGFPDGSPVARPGANVIYVDAEAVPQILNERALNYGIDRSKLFMMVGEPGEMIDLGQQSYQDRLKEMVAMLEPELIILDSLSSIHSSGQNNVEDVRALIGFLTRLVNWACCGMLLVHHIRKPASGGQSMMNFDLGMEDLSGSGYITQQARVVMGLRVVQTGPKFDPNGARELKVLKSNLSAYPDPLGFQFEPLHPAGVRLKWDVKPPKPFRERTQLDECQEWLEDFLKSHSDGVKPREVVEAGKDEGLSRPMIYRARAELSRHIVNTMGRKSPENRWQWSDVELTVDPGEDEM